MKKNNVNIWIYAVILFSSAFVILLLTAYSQIKFNRNIDDYRDSIKNNEETISENQVNLKTALEENQNIRNELNRLREEVTILREFRDLQNEVNSKNESVMKSYILLLKAIKEYSNGDISAAAEALYSDEFSIDGISEDGQNEYKIIVNYLMSSGAEAIYLNGYTLYQGKQYDDALEKFTLCLKITGDAYFSDDCYYLSIACLLYTERRAEAEELLSEMEEEYPSSKLTQEARKIFSEWL